MTGFKEENSYRNILKRLSAFGGVQIFNIVIGLLRGKFVAMFLGPSGMGISSLYASSTAPMQQIAGLGVNLAVVRDISASKETPSALRRSVTVALRLILLTSLLGALICGVAAPLWSEMSFGDRSHTSSYLFLSIFVALSVGGAGFLALLQGLGEVKRLSKASLVGGATGLLFGVPLYYFFGDGGIVPAMIILSLSTFLFYYISFRQSSSMKEAPSAPPLSFKEGLPLMRHLISTGFILLGGTLAGQIVSYAINMFIRAEGSLGDVGLYQGANSITNQYVGLIVSALALDYFPRLSACALDREKMREVVNRQIEIVLSVATPLIILLIITAPIVIELLLTDSFLVITPLMRWMGVGMLIQLLAFPLGYIYLARDDRKAYLWLECIWANVCWLGCSVLFYYLFGLIGLGISLTVRGVIDLAINYIFCLRRYGFSCSGEVMRLVTLNILLAGAVFFTSFYSGVVPTVASLLLLLASLGLSFTHLKRKLKVNES
ncbi:MAG: oligosaccharide flippase family protein [Muribaculaceae bacterium]|nr:oligosaccharide flippase family protein [Muribaculaceae bacterium]